MNDIDTELYDYECPKCGTTTLHSVRHVLTGVRASFNRGESATYGPCLIVSCQVCGYGEKRPPAENSYAGTSGEE